MLLTLLLVGAFLVSPVVAQSRVTSECSSEPSLLRVTYSEYKRERERESWRVGMIEH